jgi:glucokinase
VALALGDERGRLRARRRRPTAPSGQPERDLARLAEDARTLVSEAGTSWDEVAAIGLSLPGPYDPERELVCAPPNLPGWDAVPARRWLARALGRPVYVENDANAAALAEWRFGAGRGFHDVVFLTMSTGVGAGLVLGGRLHRGVAWGAGEVGHAPVEWGGEPCACGMRGCLEAYVGGAAWTRRLRAMVEEGGRMARLAGGRDRVSPEHALHAAAEGDAEALRELARYNEYLARGLVGIVFTLAPEVIVLGTIPSAAGEALCLGPVRERVGRRVWPNVRERLRILPSALGPDLAELAGLCAAFEGLGVAAGPPASPD